MEPIGSRFLDFNTAMTSIGQILGLVGMALFSINLILASQYKFLDKYFKGLDKVYLNHGRVGSISFSLLLFHPIFLVIKYISISTYDAALFFVPFINMPITWGILSLLLMIILMSFTFYIKLKYHIWNFSHKFMTLAFVIAVIHTLFISSDISRNNYLRYYILTLVVLGLFSIFRKVYLEKTSQNNFRYKVKNINKLNTDILEIEMEPLGKKIIFNPGQFAFFIFLSSGVSSESHPFSISSSIDDDNLKISIKNLGDYTSSLGNLKQGDEVLVDGPYGDFSYKKNDNKNQIWIAGGIGITPFFSMAQSLENEYKVDLYYSVKENKEAVYVRNFEEISQKNTNFKFNLWNATEKGYINSGLILNLSKGLDSKDIFLCGPPMFMESLKNQFLSLGVDIKRIHYENFSF